MAKAVMTADEICNLIVWDVRRHAHCDGFKSISIYPIKDERLPDIDWSPATANYGEAGREVCDAALREIISRMQRQYSLRIT